MGHERLGQRVLQKQVRPPLPGAAACPGFRREGPTAQPKALARGHKYAPPRLLPRPPWEFVGVSANRSFTSFATPVTASVTVQLNAGSNTIKFHNDSAYAPDLDSITVS